MKLLTCLMLGLIGITAVMPAATPTGGIVLLGDSTTATRQGVHKVYADRLHDSLSAGGADLAVVNAGAGGNTTRDALQRLEQDVLRHRPRLLALQFGINDSAVDVWKHPPATTARVPLPEYLDNLRTMVRSARTQGIQVILMTPNPLRWTPKLKALYGKPPYDPATEDGFESATLRPYVVALRHLATELKLPLVDIHAAYPAFAIQHQISMDALLLDGMHPNDLGHQLVAERLLPVIQNALRPPTTSSPPP
jgi:lysophospholipase L1-like esterase